MIDTAHHFASLLLCASAAALLYRAGIVHTGIIAQMIMTAVVFGYVAPFGTGVALLVAYLVSLLIIAIAVIARVVNRRSYILFLYCLSLASISIGNWVMSSIWPSGTDAVKTPTVRWLLGVEHTLALAVVIASIGLTALAQLASSWRGVLLTHWSGLPARTVRDGYLAGTFGARPLLDAFYPIALIAAGLFVSSVLVGKFALYGTYSSGEFDISPFIALVFALMTQKPIQLFLLVASYSGLKFVARMLVNESGYEFPVMGLYVLYGAAFFLFLMWSRRR